VLDIYAARREKALAEAAAADAQEEEAPMREPIRPTSLKHHVVLVGHGRVGSFISAALSERSVPLFVIEDDEEGVAALKQEGIEALEGNAADPAVIQAANLPEARCLLVAIPDAFEGGQVVQQAHAINPRLPIIARAHSEEEIDYLRRHGATLVVMGEHEIAKAMLDNVAELAMIEQALAAGAPTPPEPMLAEKPAATS
jgi:CPA2 family monovalent cation:H+ antiporter-2